MTTSEQTPATSSKQPVIVLNSWGNYHVYPASIAYAKKLLEEKLEEMADGYVTGLTALKARRALRAAPEDLTLPYVVTESVVARAFFDLATLDPEAPSRALYRLLEAAPEKGATVPVTKAHRDELVLWAFEHKMNLKEVYATALNEHHPELALSFMGGLLARAKGHPILYVDNSESNQADELEDLLYGTWKPTANVGNVVSRYLDTLNGMLHRDERYHLGTLESGE